MNIIVLLLTQRGCELRAGCGFARPRVRKQLITNKIQYVFVMGGKINEIKGIVELFGK